jgi:hypothetical protein
VSEAHTYQETIRAPIWLRLLLLGLSGAAVSALVFCREAGLSRQPDLVLALGLVAAATLLVTLVLVVLFGRLSLHVEEGRLVVRFGYLPVLHTEIPLDEITSAKAVRYQPIRHFGGWGIRSGRYQGIRTAMYSLRGAKGVLLVLRDPIDTHRLRTDHIIVGSQRPVEFAKYLLSRIRECESARGTA